MDEEMPFRVDPKAAYAAQETGRDSGLAESPEIPDSCGDLAIRIDQNGEWYYHESIIARKSLVRLFASVLSRDEAGNYWLTTPAEKCRIQVDDVPFIAVAMNAVGTGCEQVLHFETNVGDCVIADRDHPIRVVLNPETGEPSPFVTVRHRIEARIARSVYYDLVTLGREKKVDHVPVYGIWSSGIFFPLGKLDEGP